MFAAHGLESHGWMNPLQSSSQETTRQLALCNLNKARVLALVISSFGICQVTEQAMCALVMLQSVPNGAILSVGSVQGIGRFF